MEEANCSISAVGEEKEILETNETLPHYSRAYINDYDLTKKSEKEDFVKELAAMAKNVELSEEMDNDIVEEKDSSEEDFTKLPTCFGGNARPAKKRKNFLNYSSLNFEDYWKNSQTYLIYSLWKELYGHTIVDEVAKKKLDEDIRSWNPGKNYLINAHRDILQNESYKNILLDHEESNNLKTTNELYEFFAEKVKAQSEKDFMKEKSSVLAKKCRNFMNKIENMGFVKEEDLKQKPTEKEQQKKNRDDDSEPEVEPIKSRALKGTRFPVVYGDNDIFGDVHVEFEEPSSSQHYRPFKRLEGDEDDKDVTEEEEDHKETNVSEIRFKYDPETEHHLLASNAHEYYQTDSEIRKYFYQRYRLFSRLDHGILMDREGWFSVTPERIAAHIADRLVIRENMIIVDAFAGVGGNSIQFALKGARVIAIDLDPIRLKCAIQNAKVYGVEDRIEFICADFFHFAARFTNKKENDVPLQVDSVFLSPPWGGPSYLKKKVFDLGDGLTPNGFDIFTAARAMSPNIAYFLPRNTCIKQLISLAGPGNKCEIEQSCLNKKVKTLTAYYGELACTE
ncbi:unnamed protein product [Auanema sp. JU1783]|nr:unnamed protein product [Auanema sp. JU1783]